MQNIISIANNFILKNGIKDLPLDLDGLIKICGSLGYKVRSYAQAKEAIQVLGMTDFMKYSAFTYREGAHKWVFFSDSLSVGTRNFVIAHEIGHIVLRHNYDGAVGYTEADTEQEHEANNFAYQLLAPLCVLKAKNIFDIDDIESYTLLDTRHAKVVHKALHNYRWQSREDELIKAYEPKPPKKHIYIPLILGLLAALLLAVSIFLRIRPDTQEPVETTTSIIDSLRGKLSQASETTYVEAAETQSTATSIAETETVYVTVHGERYHKQNCYHIKNKTTSALSISEAIEDGYTACKSCYRN